MAFIGLLYKSVSVSSDEPSNEEMLDSCGTDVAVNILLDLLVGAQEYEISCNIMYLFGDLWKEWGPKFSDIYRTAHASSLEHLILMFLYDYGILCTTVSF